MSLQPTFEPPAAVDRGDGAWPWWSPILAVLMALAVTFLVTIILSGIAAASGATVTSHHTPGGVTIGGTIAQDLALLACSFGAVWAIVGRPAPADFGWRPVHWKTYVFVVVVAFAAYWLITYLYSLALSIDDKEDVADKFGIDSGNAWAIVGVTFLACVTAPLAEETFFRGFLFRALAERFNVWIGVVVSGVIFGAVHGAGTDAKFLPALAAFGIVLAVAYWWSGSLYVTITMHVINNSIAIVGGFNWDWAWLPVIMFGSGALVALTLLGAARLGLRPVRPRFARAS